MSTKIRISDLPLEDASRSMPSTPRVGVGIDLGTTNSVVAIGVWDPVDPGLISVQCVEVEQPTLDLGNQVGTLVPSIVALAEGRTLVGEGAKRLVAAGAVRGLRRNRDYFFETKNEMGTDRRYAQASPGYQSPGEIGGHILEFLMAAAKVEPNRTVVTVPASFQIAQRHETTAAAARAGFDLLNTQLFDEPLAALVGFFSVHPERIPIRAGTGRNILVFDFGGGTCDIAVVSLFRKQSGQLSVSPRGISRFHRLGGGDIDAAIVYEHLIPLLLEQNKLPARTFGFPEKRNLLEPALRPIAEGLKAGLCQELVRRERLGLAEDPALERRFPGRHTVSVGEKRYTLDAPALTLGTFEKIIKPFFDRNMLAPVSDEYRTMRSIFAPIEDCIWRTGLRPDEIDACLLAGGSSNIPQAQKALKALLPNAEILSFDSADASKECVARGAAIAATILAVTGKTMITPICFDEISVLTQDGKMVLIPAGANLPFPNDGGSVQIKLHAPRDSIDTPLPLRVAVVAASEDRQFFEQIWPLSPPVKAGEPLTVDCRMDANQVLHLKLGRNGRADQEELSGRIESPLTHVQNPVKKEIQAETLERLIAGGTLRADERERKARELSRVLDELGQREKALATLRALLAQKGAPDAGLINSMALIVTKMGDHDEAFDLFEQAAAAAPDWDIPLFNLALFRRRKGDLVDARDAINRALERESCGCSHTLLALVAKELGDNEKMVQALNAATSIWPAVKGMDDWMLYWYLTWAREIGNDAAIRSAEAEKDRRQRSQPGSAAPDGELPVSE